MPVATNSKKAYKAIKDLGDKQRLVYYQVKGMEAKGELPSNQDIADALGWPINRVTGRVNELKEYGYLRVHGVKMGRYGTPVNIHCTADPNDKYLLNLDEDDEYTQSDYLHSFGVADG